MMTENPKPTTTGKANTFAAAFLGAQSEFPEIPKDSEATVKGTTKDGKRYEYKYRYASLPAILRAVLPVLHKHGLFLLQILDGDHLTTSLNNADGVAVQGSLPMPSPVGMNPQDFGKITTYMRRYSLIALLGIAPDDDDDCVGVKAPPPVQPPLAEPKPASTPASTHIDCATRLIDEQHTLVENWSVKEFDSRGDALRTVGDYLDALEISSGDDLYTVAIREMKNTVDKRNA
jgi:hypothetical protein